MQILETIKKSSSNDANYRKSFQTLTWIKFKNQQAMACVKNPDIFEEIYGFFYTFNAEKSLFPIR